MEGEKRVRWERREDTSENMTGKEERREKLKDRKGEMLGKKTLIA